VSGGVESAGEKDMGVINKSEGEYKSSIRMPMFGENPIPAMQISRGKQQQPSPYRSKRGCESIARTKVTQKNSPGSHSRR